MPSQVPARGAVPTKGEPERREAVVTVVTPAVPTAHEAVQPGTRRRFTASDKLRLVKAAEAAVASYALATRDDVLVPGAAPPPR